MPRKNTATATEQGTDNTAPAEGTAPETAVEETLDISAFETAVTEAVAKRDTSTGELAAAEIEPVRKAYRDLSGLKAKNAAKGVLTDGMQAAITARDITLARTYQVLQEVAVAPAAKKESTPAKPVDPTEAFVGQYVTLQLALGDLKSRVPEGVEADWETRATTLYGELFPQVGTLRTYLSGPKDDEGNLSGDEPEVSPLVKAALKVQSGKAAKARKASSGVRHDIGKHISEYFADKESGHFATVATIAGFRSEEYGDDSPSQGAVSARLFPKSGGNTTVPGITSGQQDGTGVKGARKN